MIYLAINQLQELERIQVVRKPEHPSVWGALNHDGTQEIIPFSEDNVTPELVLIALQRKYPNSDITLSKRIVDSQKYHIICINGRYCLYDNNAHLVAELGIEMVCFSNPQISEIQATECNSCPDYFVNIDVVHKNHLWVGQDIDTQLWACFLQNGKIISQSRYKDVAIHIGVQNL